MPRPAKKKKASHRRRQGVKQTSIATTRTSFPIVAIGASAGGLEAFSRLLRALPPQPGVALIFIPHLDPTHESAMVELLARTTRLRVWQAEEGMRVECNALACCFGSNVWEMECRVSVSPSKAHAPRTRRWARLRELTSA